MGNFAIHLDTWVIRDYLTRHQRSWLCTYTSKKRRNPLGGSNSKGASNLSLAVCLLGYLSSSTVTLLLIRGA